MQGSVTTTAPLERLYTLRQLSAETGLSMKVLRRAIQLGRLRAIQPTGPGGSVYVTVSDYLRWLDAAAIDSRSEPDVPATLPAPPDIAWDFTP